MLEIDGVFEGGGAKGAAYIGALTNLQEKGIWFKRVAGSSAGAITAALIAAGYRAFCEDEQSKAGKSEYASHAECIQGIVYNTDFNAFKDKPRFALWNLLNRSGFYKGDAFLNWVEARMPTNWVFLSPLFPTCPSTSRLSSVTLPTSVTSSSTKPPRRTCGWHLPSACP